MDRKMIAGELLKMAKELVGMEFPTQEALDKYLKDHPDANRSNHKVKETKRTPSSLKGKGLVGPVYDEFKSLEKMDKKTKEDHVDKMIESKGIDQVKRHFKILYKHLSDNGSGMDDAAVVQEAINYVEKREEEKK